MNHNNLDLGKVIDGFEQNFRKDYDTLSSDLRRSNVVGEKIDEAILINIIKQFHLSVIRLNQSHIQLVNELLKVDWSKGSDELSQEFQSFVLDLLAAHTALYLCECLKITVSQFAPRVPPSKNKSTIVTSPEEIEVQKLGNQRRHDMLQKIVKIVPSSVMILESLLAQCYPPTGNLLVQENYASNLLTMSGYLPKMRGYILKLILSKLIVYDSESSKEEIQKMESTTDSAINEDANKTESGESSRTGAMKHVKADLLDRLMEMMFVHIRNQCYKGDNLSWEAAKKFYVDLKKSFGALQLKAFKTCHVQFLMFFLCSFKLDLAVDFLEYLWAEVTSLNKDSFQRQLSVSHLGSFLSRAKYIPTWLIQRQLVRMKNWIHNYIDNCSDQHRPLFEVHGVFYTVCQAFFYIIVFRHRDIIDTARGHKFCMDLHLQKIASCLLNPLRFCHLPISEMFCSVVRGNQIAFCDNILERNRRQMIAESEGDHLRNVIVSYFPYDPYVLHRSMKYVEPIYLDYDTELFNLNVKKETLDEEMEYQECDDRDPLGIEIQMSPKMQNFFLYGSSPGFKN